MSMSVVEVSVILALILANGACAMAELAVVSSQKGRLRRLAESGDRRARVVLELAEDPNRFLATVQIGITLIGTLAGVFGGATLAEDLAARLRMVPPLARYAEPLGLAAVVLGVAYVSLVLGELVPKRLALGNPERVAIAAAVPLRWLSRVGVPAVRLLGASTDMVLRLLGARPSANPPVTDDAVTGMMSEGARAGVFEVAEHEMVKRVLRLGDRKARALMTPRSEIVWIDAADPPAEVLRKVAASPHDRFPVAEGGLDNLLGVLRAKDLLTRVSGGQPFDLRGLLTMPLLVYGRTPCLTVLESFRSTGTHTAVVLDEYGSVQGLLTTSDILEAIVGDLPENGQGATDAKAVRREDGSWLLDGALAVDELEDYIAVQDPPRGDYDTLAGLVIARLGRIPSVADHFDWVGHRFEVVDMDGNRVDKILVTPNGSRPA